MRQILFSLLLSFALLGCMSTKSIPLKGTYTNGNFEATTPTPKDKVWDNIVDFFSKKGLSIKIIDRSSGLIVSDETALTWSYEDKNGKLVHPDAWVAIKKILVSGSNTPIKPNIITGEWNIRIKGAPNNQTSIAVNLVNQRYINQFAITPTAFSQGGIQSTGVFEKMIYDQIK